MHLRGQSTIPKYTYVVLTNPVEGREAEYNEWYDNQHLSDVLQIPGMVGAQRFHAAPELISSGEAKWHYLAIYDIETDNLNGVFAEMQRRAGTSVLPISDALDLAGVHAVAYLRMEDAKQG